MPRTCLWLIALAPFGTLAGCAGLALLPSAAPPVPRVEVSPLFSAEVYDRIAVYVQDNSGQLRRDPGALRSVEDEFMRAALAKGYTLAARSDMEAILREIEVQRSGVTESALAAGAKAINVSAVMIVSINQVSITPKSRTMRNIASGRTFTQRYYEATADISARLISADLAEVVWISGYTSSAEVASRDRQAGLLPSVAGVVASGLPSRRDSPSLDEAGAATGSTEVR